MDVLREWLPQAVSSGLLSWPSLGVLRVSRDRQGYGRLPGARQGRADRARLMMPEDKIMRLRDELVAQFPQGKRVTIGWQGAGWTVKLQSLTSQQVRRIAAALDTGASEEGE